MLIFEEILFYSLKSQYSTLATFPVNSTVTRRNQTRNYNETN